MTRGPCSLAFHREVAEVAYVVVILVMMVVAWRVRTEGQLAVEGFHMERDMEVVRARSARDGSARRGANCHGRCGL